MDDLFYNYENNENSNKLLKVAESNYGNAAQGINPEYAWEIYYEEKRL